MLTVQQVAHRLNCADGLVRRLIYAGKLPASQLGRDWRIDPDDLDAFLAGSRPARPVERAEASELPPSSRRFH